MKFFLLEANDCDAAFFVSCFAQRGNEITRFRRPIELLDALRISKPDLTVLEWCFPEMTGETVLRRVKEFYGSAVPAIVLSGIDRAEGIIQAFGAGADDYLLKPMTRPVLVARIESLMRRLRPAAAPSEPGKFLLLNGPYRLDFGQQTAHIEDVPVAVTPKELDLAWLLFNSVEQFISKAALVACVWGKRAEIAPHTVTQHLHVVRKKFRLRDYGYNLTSIYGSGYRLTAPHAWMQKPQLCVQPHEAGLQRQSLV